MTKPAPFTLSALLAQGAADRPAALAASDLRESLTFAGLEERVAGQAKALADLGLGCGDSVALWMPNSVDYLAATFAIARLAATAVHINTRFRAREVGELLRRSAARVLITDLRFELVDFAAIIEAMADDDLTDLATIVAVGDSTRASRVRRRTVVPLSATAAGPDFAGPDLAMPDAPCLTFTTSGTTAAPKLVLHTQRSVAHHAGDVADATGLRREDAAALAMMPLCGTFGNAFAMAAVVAGAHTILMDRFDPASAVALIRQHRVTHLATTDDVLRRLADEAGSRPLETICFGGFASFSPAAGDNVAVAAAAGLRPRGLYGSSECQAFFAVAPQDDALRDGGVPVSPRAVVALRDVATDGAPEEGREGELCLAGPSLFDGYLHDPDATKQAWTADGLFRSSDVATMQGSRILFRHRMGDTLRLGGFLVDPVEIESVLKTQAGVAGAQVVAIELGGKHATVAFVTPAAGDEVDVAGLEAACRRDLAAHKVPARIVVVAHFPMTDSPNGQKIQKGRLRELAHQAMWHGDGGRD